MKTFLCVIIRFTCDDFKGFYLFFFLGTKQEARKWELGDLTEKCGKSVPRRRRQRQRKTLVIESTIWAERAIFCRVWKRKVVIATITSRLHLSTPLLAWLRWASFSALLCFRGIGMPITAGFVLPATLDLHRPCPPLFLCCVLSPSLSLSCFLWCDIIE